MGPRSLDRHPETCAPPAERSPADGGATAAADVTISKKQLKRLFDGARPLDAWERYRALNDAIGEAYDLIDVNNREARFAFILLGGLNAFILIAATQNELVASLSPQHRAWTGGLLVVYAVMAVYFLLEAIGALRPGRFRPDLGNWPSDSPDYPRRLRYFEDVVLRDVESHWKAWRDVEVEQLNAELAVQLHSLSQKNQAMRKSLRRLYGGLRIMTLLVTALLFVVVFSRWL